MFVSEQQLRSAEEEIQESSDDEEESLSGQSFH